MQCALGGYERCVTWGAVGIGDCGLENFHICIVLRDA